MVEWWNIQVRENSTNILEKDKTKEFKEIWKDVSLRVILKHMGYK